jgi:DNA-binding NtrC family response regulator
LRLGPAALACLHAHHWPGNVRELENALRAAAVRAAGPEITAAELPLEGAAAQPRTLAQTLELATEAAVRAALRRREGDAGRAAAELGLSPGEFRTLAGRFHIPSE